MQLYEATIEHSYGGRQILKVFLLVNSIEEIADAFKDELGSQKILQTRLLAETGIRPELRGLTCLIDSRGTEQRD